MPLELVYTSAPRGLLPGSSGFCTVAMTRGLASVWREALERLSTYVRLPKGDPRQHPASYSHYPLSIGGETRAVLSRIAANGLDHTQRTNHLAHFVLLSADEVARLPAGPAQLMSQPKFLRESFLSAPSEADAKPLPTVPEYVALSGSHWERLTGDAGWGRVLAQAFEADQTAFLIVEPKQDVLPLIAEALSYLSPERRWGIAFSTYAPTAPPGVRLQCRGVVRGTPAEREAHQAEKGGALVLDLHLGPQLGRAPETAIAAMPATVGGAAEGTRPPSEWDMDLAALEKGLGDFKPFPGVSRAPADAFAAAVSEPGPPPVRLPGLAKRSGTPWLAVILVGLLMLALGAVVSGAGVYFTQVPQRDIRLAEQYKAIGDLNAKIEADNKQSLREHGIVAAKLNGAMNYADMLFDNLYQESKDAETERIRARSVTAKLNTAISERDKAASDLKNAKSTIDLLRNQLAAPAQGLDEIPANERTPKKPITLDLPSDNQFALDVGFRENSGIYKVVSKCLPDDSGVTIFRYDNNTNLMNIQLARQKLPEEKNYLWKLNWTIESSDDAIKLCSKLRVRIVQANSGQVFHNVIFNKIK